MAKDDGGPAFPNLIDAAELGMSLRDYFAAESIRGAADAICDQLTGEDADSAKATAHAEQHAIAAYLIADAMVAERKK